jgi:hypothetical protein
MLGHLLNSLDTVSLLDIAGARSIQKETRARFPPRLRYERGYQARRFGSGQRNRKRAMTVRADATQQVFQNPNDIFPSAMSRHFSVRQPSCNRSCPPGVSFQFAPLTSAETMACSSCTVLARSRTRCRFPAGCGDLRIPDGPCAQSLGRPRASRGAHVEIGRLARTFKITLDEWTQSVSELATWIRYSPPPPGAKPVEPWFEDQAEDDGGPETIQ